MWKYATINNITWCKVNISDNLKIFGLIQYKNHKNDNNMCPTYREIRLIQSNLSDLSDKFNMELGYKDRIDTYIDKCI